MRCCCFWPGICLAQIVVLGLLAMRGAPSICGRYGASCRTSADPNRQCFGSASQSGGLGNSRGSLTLDAHGISFWELPRAVAGRSSRSLGSEPSREDRVQNEAATPVRQLWSTLCPQAALSVNHLKRSPAPKGFFSSAMIAGQKRQYPWNCEARASPGPVRLGAL